MNYRLLSKVLAMLLFLISLAMGLCLAYAVWAQERGPGRDAVEAFSISIGISVAAGLALFLTGRGSGRDVLRKEAVAIVGLGWLICGLFGALPYLLCQPDVAQQDVDSGNSTAEPPAPRPVFLLPPAEAFFESMSGFTTTGASAITDLDRFPRSILLWRSLTQWLGGLGILVLFVALLSYLGVGSKSLFRHESSAKTSEGLQSRIRSVAMRLWQIYLVLSIVCCVGLLALGMSFYEALSHTLTTISTGGFSPENRSIAAYDNVWIELWMVLFMILGGISFMLYAWLLRGRWDRWQKEEETKFFLLILALATLIIAADLVLVGTDYSLLHALRAAVFQVVSIMTTTGFATEDYDKWPPLARVVLILVMAIGGCAGSTAGGIKVSRWILFFKIVRLEVIAAFRPNQVIALQLNGNPADEELKMQTVFFIALAAVTVSLGTGLVSLLQPNLDMISSFSAVVASLFNIGPGLRAVGPTQNYAHLLPTTHVVLALLMILGRLEFFAVMVLFVPSLWKKY